MCLPKLLWCVHVLFTTSRCHYAYLCYFCCLHLLTTSNLPTLLCLQTGESRPSDRCTPAAQPALHHRRPACTAPPPPTCPESPKAAPFIPAIAGHHQADLPSKPQPPTTPGSEVTPLSVPPRRPRHLFRSLPRSGAGDLRTSTTLTSPPRTARTIGRVVQHTRGTGNALQRAGAR